MDRLPPESATLTALRLAAPEPDDSQETAEFDPEQGQWSRLEMLVADLIDDVRALRWVTVSLKVKSPPPAPAPYPRPGVAAKPKAPRRRASSLTAEQRALLDPRLRVVKDPPGAVSG